MRVRIQDNGGARLMRRWQKAKTERGIQQKPWEENANLPFSSFHKEKKLAHFIRVYLVQ